MHPGEQETAEDQVTESSENGGGVDAGGSFAEVREGNVDEVVAYADSHPEEAEGLAAAEAGGKDRKGVREGIEKGVADRAAEGPSDEEEAAVLGIDPGARARAESEAALAQERARPSGPADDEEGPALTCDVHGGVLQAQQGKFRWRCDRALEEGTCMAERVDDA